MKVGKDCFYREEGKTSSICIVRSEDQEDSTGERREKNFYFGKRRRGSVASIADREGSEGKEKKSAGRKRKYATGKGSKKQNERRAYGNGSAAGRAFRNLVLIINKT